LDDTETAFARLAALLHDVGHIVNGHTIEDELGKNIIVDGGLTSNVFPVADELQ